MTDYRDSAPDIDLEVMTADQAAEAELKRKQDEVITRMLPMLDKAAAYNSVIMGAGYAAFFTIWNGFRGRLPASVILVTGGLIGFSIMVFLIWELVKSQRQTWSASKIGLAVQRYYATDQFWPHWNAAWALQARDATIINKFQAWVFFGAAGTGVAAAAILAVAALSVGLPKYWSEVFPSRPSAQPAPASAPKVPGAKPSPQPVPETAQKSTAQP